jgi:hypothetical protein
VSSSLVAPGIPAGCAAWQFQIACPIDTGRNCEGAAQACGLIDGALQNAALIIGTAGANAELRGIETECAGRGRRGCCWHRRRKGKTAGSGNCNKASAIEMHAGFSSLLAIQDRHQSSRCRPLHARKKFLAVNEM